MNIQHQNLNCLILQKKYLRALEKATTVYWSTRRNPPKDLNLQQNRCEKLIPCDLLQYFCWRKDTSKTCIRILRFDGFSLINRLSFLSSTNKVTSNLLPVCFGGGTTQDLQTPRIRVRIEKLLFTHLLKKFSTFHIQLHDVAVLLQQVLVQ